MALQDVLTAQTPELMALDLIFAGGVVVINLSAGAVLLLAKRAYRGTPIPALASVVTGLAAWFLVGGFVALARTVFFWPWLLSAGSVCPGSGLCGRPGCFVGIAPERGSGCTNSGNFA